MKRKFTFFNLCKKVSVLTAIGMFTVGQAIATDVSLDKLFEHYSTLNKKSSLVLSSGQQNPLEMKFTIIVNKVSLADFITSLQKSVGDKAFFNLTLDETLKKIDNISINAKDMTLKQILDNTLPAKGVTYSVKGNVFIIHKASAPTAKKIDVKGVTLDAQTKKPIAGATIIILGTTDGAISNDKGQFNFTAKEGAEIEVTFVGMKTVVQKINAASSSMVIELQQDAMAVEDIVVTGYANKSRNSFTGSAVTVGREQLKSMGQKNILSALSNFVPGMELLVDNKMGSDPNSRPEILIRGRSSLSGASNTPTFILDGMQISLDEVFDLNMNDIENITVLKDASASALYGARAANGVIVITSKRLEVSKMRVAYNFNLKISAPDLSDYNLLNSAQKLEFERLAGDYTATEERNQYALDVKYNERYKEMRRGVDTYWLAAPLNTAVSHSHSLNIYGGSDNVRYMMNARYEDENGIMKSSGRTRYGVNFRLSYNVNNKITFQNYVSIAGTTNNESPYGNFGDYTKQNPYDRIYDVTGNLTKGTLSSNTANPLLEATYGSYNTGKGMTVSDNFEFKWNILTELALETKFSISSTLNESDKFISPNSLAFKDTQKQDKGSYTNTINRSGRYEGSAFLNYNKTFNSGTLLYLLAGVNLSQDMSDNKGIDAYGFYSDKLDHISFASGYKKNGAPSGSLSRSRMLGFSFNANYIIKDRYFADASFRTEGSSKYGVDDRFSTFWTAGIGWNIHKENFLSSSSIENLKLRANVGQSGNNSFDPYQAITTYKFDQKLIYKYGMGANPINIGNPNLKWERTMSYAAGIDFTLKNRLIDVSLDYYQRITDNLLTDINKAPSTGVQTAKQNLGKIKNTGIEARMNIILLKNKDIFWSATAMASHNKNTILKIDNSLKKINEERSLKKGVAPLQTYEEGKSTSAVRVVRSAGIDPATGKEIFIKRDGSWTYIYDATDKVEVGDTSPFIYGSLSSNFTYKEWTLGIMTNYRMGATIYNETLATRVEGATTSHNADIRVFNSRWKKPGDVTRYKNIADSSTPDHTDRFVEDEYQFGIGSIELSYQFRQEFCRKLLLQNIRLSFYANDLTVLSTVGQERGLNYPFARNFQFALSVTF